MARDHEMLLLAPLTLHRLVYVANENHSKLDLCIIIGILKTNTNLLLLILFNYFKKILDKLLLIN